MNKQKENLEKLFQLIKENPELPIVPMVDSEIVCENYGIWMGSIGKVKTERYIMVDDGFYFYSEKDSEVLEYFGTNKARMSDEELKQAYENLPWIEAIIVNIDLPEI